MSDRVCDFCIFLKTTNPLYAEICFSFLTPLIHHPLCTLSECNTEDPFRRSACRDGLRLSLINGFLKCLLRTAVNPLVFTCVLLNNTRIQALPGLFFYHSPFLCLLIVHSSLPALSPGLLCPSGCVYIPGALPVLCVASRVHCDEPIEPPTGQEGGMVLV